MMTHFPFRFPAASTELCRFGDPFRGSVRPVVEFQAAVGTTANSADVLPFQRVVLCFSKCLVLNLCLFFVR